MNGDVACKHFNLLKVVIAKRGELQMGCLSSGNLKEGKVGTTSLLTLVLWATIVKLPNPADPTAGHVCAAKTHL